MTFPWLRKRMKSSTTVLVPGNASYPVVPGSLASESAAQVSLGGFYHFHLGDIITHGASNWALDPSHDTQVFPIWGNGVVRAQYFEPLKPQVIYAQNAAPFDAIRGIIFQGIAPERLGPVSTEAFNG